MQEKSSQSDDEKKSDENPYQVQKYTRHMYKPFPLQNSVNTLVQNHFIWFKNSFFMNLHHIEHLNFGAKTNSLGTFCASKLTFFRKYQKSLVKIEFLSEKFSFASV